VSTLHPERLKPEDFLDLSEKKSMTIRFPDSGLGRGAALRYTSAEIDLPFPRHSRGFLYYISFNSTWCYHSEPHAASLEGSIRFRVTPDGTPASFLRGQDLLAPWALPWQITLLQIARFPKYARIREQVLREKLAKEGQLAHCRSIFRERISPQWMLFRLDSPFAVNFSAQISLTAVADTLLHPLRLDFFRDSLPVTYKRSAVARFEPSTRPEHAGRRVIHLRIVKI
ncbi:hypothetical protein C8R44DRAFT_598226, partial [Mycena epipterygia]